MGKGSIAENHPLALGPYGLLGRPATNEYVLTADFGLTLGTLNAALLNTVTTLLSLICCAVALTGIRIGTIIRKRLSDKVFQTTILWVILALGLRLIVTNGL